MLLDDYLDCYRYGTKSGDLLFICLCLSTCACLHRMNTSEKQPREANGVHDYIKERTIRIGNYVIETRKTVRMIAKEFGVSKSTVHKDLTERLPEINAELAKEVKEILDYHKSIRHIRGGEATREKYKLERQKELK